MRQATMTGLAVVALFFCSANATATEDIVVPERADLEGEEARLEVLQNRKYNLLHEISLLGGALPADAYYKGYTGSLGYTLHFTEGFAWEVLQFTYSLNLDTKLKKELVRVAASQAQSEPEFPEITWIAASHLVLKPFYGKEAWFNTDIVHLEVFLQAGPTFLRRGGNASESLAFGFEGGFGVRFWLAKWASLRFDVYELVYFLEQKPEQAIRLLAGIAFNLRDED